MTPVSSSPMLELQRAIVATLSADATLMGLVTGVFDEPPENAKMPYVRVGDHLSIQYNAHGEFGREAAVTVHVWTKVRSSLPGQTIANRIGEILDHQTDALELVGHRIVSIRQEFDQSLRDPQPNIRHHVIRFRIRTAQEE